MVKQMVNWRQNKLSFWLSGIVAVGCIGFVSSTLNAQSPYPSSAQDAGKLFGQLLNADDKSYFDLRSRAISREDFKVLGPLGIDAILKDIKLRANKLQFSASATRQENGVSVVDITPEPASYSVPVAVVQNQVGTQVDLLGTYKLLTKLSEGAFQKRVFDLTDVVLKGLPVMDEAELHNRVCRKNLAEIQTGLKMYLEDYDFTYPPADKWMDVLKEYVPSQEVFNCPASAGGKGGYAFNSNLSMQPYKAVAEPGKTQAVYETSDFIPNSNGTGQKSDFRHKTAKNNVPVANILNVKGEVTTVSANQKLEFGLKRAIPKMRH